MASHEAHADHEREKDDTWADGREKMRDISKKGGFAGFARKEPDTVRHAFSEHTSTLCCMDERVVANESNGVFAAGSGILIKDSLPAREAFIRRLKEAGVTEVTLHKGCGAVALYAKRKGISIEKAEKRAEEWAQYLAKRLKGTYEGKREVSPESHHNAQVIYYDFTGQFNPGRVSEFPPGLVISRPLVGGRNALAQLKIAKSIVFGDHGYGKRFNVLHPLKIVIVANSRFDVLKGHMEVGGLSTRILVTSFIRPKPKA